MNLDTAIKVCSHVGYDLIKDVLSSCRAINYLPKTPVSEEGRSVKLVEVSKYYKGSIRVSCSETVNCRYNVLSKPDLQLSIWLWIIDDRTIQTRDGPWQSGGVELYPHNFQVSRDDNVPNEGCVKMVFNIEGDSTPKAVLPGLGKHVVLWY